jgi:hypothetical protein
MIAPPEIIGIVARKAGALPLNPRHGSLLTTFKQPVRPRHTRAPFDKDAGDITAGVDLLLVVMPDLL